MNDINIFIKDDPKFTETNYQTPIKDLKEERNV